jgi:hypothetical protein
MSIVVDKIDPKNNRYVKDSAKILTANPKDKKTTLSSYTPNELERQCRNEFLKDFRLGWQTMHLPRPEFNDMSLYQRHIIDMLSFNTYQENDGNPMMEDRLGGWQSTAMRPIIRNASVSIAAHQTARQLVPKLFAYNQDDEEQEDAAKVMSYLVDWAREEANYPYKALFRNIAALYSPISWGYSEYVEVFKNIKDGSNLKYKQVIDEEESGFQHIPLSCDQVYFSNFYEREVQKQDFIIIRRVISFDKAVGKYGKYKNFKYVQPGIIVTMDDANSGFYNVYDPHMRQEEVEEVIRWRKSTDSKEVMVNGVLMTEPYAENPRADHQYPLDAFYYLPINERCIAGKSLVFSLQSDARLANEFYQMISDATKLNLFPPTVTSGSDKTGTDVIVPGLNLAFADKDVTINPLRTANDASLRTTMETLEKIESSIHESSQDPIQQGQNTGQGPASTAYEISRIEQNSATVLGLSIKFFTFAHVIPYGKLLLSDILQYMTMPDAEKITKEGGLLYKTFYAKEPGKNGKQNKIQFDSNMPDSMTEKEKLDMSWKLLIAQGGLKSNTTLWKVNPSLFRDHKFKFAVDADVLNPRSAELERAFDLETYDRAVASPVANQEEIYKDLLMATNPKTERNPDKYVTKQAPPAPGGMGGPGGPPPPANGQKGTPSASKPSMPSSNRASLPVKA